MIHLRRLGYGLLFAFGLLAAVAVFIGPLVASVQSNDGRYAYLYLIHIVAALYGLGADIQDDIDQEKTLNRMRAELIKNRK